MTPTPIALVALDVAGTTVDEGGAVYRTLADAVRSAGADPSPADVGRWMGAGKREAITALLTTPKGPPTQSLVDRAFTDFRDRLAAAYRDHPPHPIDGVPETLRELRSLGIRVALTTGFDHEVTDSLLLSLGWDDQILDAVVCVDDVAAGRPAPYMIFRAMEATGTSRTRAVLVAGDTRRDIHAGRNAGAGLVVGVLTGETAADDLAVEQPDHILASVVDLPSVISSME